MSRAVQIAEWKVADGDRPVLPPVTGSRVGRGFVSRKAVEPPFAKQELDCIQEMLPLLNLTYLIWHSSQSIITYTYIYSALAFL